MKEVFVFGAGASYASAETPLGKDLVWSYCSDCFDYLKKDKDFLEFLKSDPKFKKSAHREETRHPATLHILDSEKSIDEIMKELQNTPGTTDIIKLIKFLTFKHIACTSSQPKTVGLSLYEQFAKSLSGRSVSEVSVISFNLDCLLHEEFKSTNVYRPVYFDYIIPFNSVDSGRSYYNRQKGIPLIKLHGSLDWAFNSRTEKIELLNWAIKPETYINGSGIEPYIFLPYQTRGSLTNILREKAKEELQQAAKITIVGYSFPDYDKDVIELFQENIKSEIEFEVVDLAPDSFKQEEIQIKYVRLFSNIANIKFNFDGFESYMCREVKSI